MSTRMLAALLVLVIGGCDRQSQGEAGHAQRRLPAPAAQAPQKPAAQPAALPRVNAERAFGHVKEIVAFGPRPVNSPGMRRQREYILAKLKGIQVEQDSFTASTPAGELPMTNLIAKFPGTEPGVILVASHYDTNHPLKNYVGANDGASSSGLLLELAHHLREQSMGGRRPGKSVWLVWFDGEEAIREWSDTDSLYGSRHLAARWEKDGTLKQIRAMLLLDMVGDADLNIVRDTNSTPWLQEMVRDAAKEYGSQQHFFGSEMAIADDHLPFIERGVPAVDLIDLEYGPGRAYWHTSKDTLDKLSPRSLQIVGDVTLRVLSRLDQN